MRPVSQQKTGGDEFFCCYCLLGITCCPRQMIANNIAYWRSSMNQGKGISQAHLARRVGVGRSFVTKLEKGCAQPGAELMLRIADYLKQPVEAIFKLVYEGRNKEDINWPDSLPASQINSLSQTSSRLSNGTGDGKGQIVAIRNGEGRGVTCRAVSQK